MAPPSAWILLCITLAAYEGVLMADGFSTRIPRPPNYDAHVCKEQISSDPDSCLREYWKVQCPTYCTTTRQSKACTDDHIVASMCDTWKDAGQCESPYVSEQCPNTCRKCRDASTMSIHRRAVRPTCRDTEAYCPVIARKGLCNRAQFKARCRLSCGVCISAQVCKDTLSECRVLKRVGQCRLPTIQALCPRSCLACPHSTKPTTAIEPTTTTVRTTTTTPTTNNRPTLNFTPPINTTPTNITPRKSTKRPTTASSRKSTKPTCFDRTTFTCKRYATAGLCTDKKHSKLMRKECAFSCGLCTGGIRSTPSTTSAPATGYSRKSTEPPCFDRTTFTCKRYATAGLCTDKKHSKLMRKECAFSCGLCTDRIRSTPSTTSATATGYSRKSTEPTCFDRTSFTCKRYATAGLCTDKKYSKLMRKECAFSCGFCTDGIRSTLTTTAVTRKPTATQVTTTTTRLTTSLTKFTKISTIKACSDKSAITCKRYAAAGMCTDERLRALMNRECALSCGLCTPATTKPMSTTVFTTKPTATTTATPMTSPTTSFTPSSPTTPSTHTLLTTITKPTTTTTSTSSTPTTANTLPTTTTALKPSTSPTTAAIHIPTTSLTPPSTTTPTTTTLLTTITKPTTTTTLTTTTVATTSKLPTTTTAHKTSTSPATTTINTPTTSFSPLSTPTPSTTTLLTNFTKPTTTSTSKTSTATTTTTTLSTTTTALKPSTSPTTTTIYTPTTSFSPLYTTTPSTTTLLTTITKPTTTSTFTTTTTTTTLPTTTTALKFSTSPNVTIIPTPTTSFTPSSTTTSATTVTSTPISATATTLPTTTTALTTSTSPTTKNIPKTTTILITNTIPTTTTTKQSSTTQSFGFSCDVCDPAKDGSCTAKREECDADKQFCMNTLEDRADGKRMVTKSCVTKAVCTEQWFQETFDKDECLDVMYGYPTTILNRCSFCCTTPGCNVKDVPPEMSLYQP